MSELRRLLPRLVYPLGAAFSLLGLGLLLQVLRWRRVGLVLVVAGFGWLWVWSTPVFSNWLQWTLEREYRDVPVEMVRQADAIVVLGGAFTHRSLRPYPDLSGSADRYWHGARLFHAGRGDVVILSGGRMPGRGAGLTEAEAGALFLRDLGVPEEAMVLDTQALTTRDNAVNIAAMLAEMEIDNFLLVTSATHMRRSMGCFRVLGLRPVPVATDFQANPNQRLGLSSFLPSSQALAGSTRAAHEYVGMVVYRVRGWV
jgi:uncharacterized SAM-binding protein YcdF (DUF218 family)